MLDPIVRMFVITQLRLKESAEKMRDQEGASAVEYGLLVGLIAVAIVATITLLGGSLNALFVKINNAVK